MSDSTYDILNARPPDTKAVAPLTSSSILRLNFKGEPQRLPDLTMPPFPRPQTALRTSQLLHRRTLITPATPKSISQAIMPISVPVRSASTQSTHGAASHAQHGTEEHTGDHGHSHDMYEPPTGWLWGIPPGEQYQKEGWEGLWYWGFYGSLVVAAVAYAWKPDTRYVFLVFGVWVRRQCPGDDRRRGNGGMRVL